MYLEHREIWNNVAEHLLLPAQRMPMAADQVYVRPDLNVTLYGFFSRLLPRRLAKAEQYAWASLCLLWTEEADAVGVGDKHRPQLYGIFQNVLKNWYHVVFNAFGGDASFAETWARLPHDKREKLFSFMLRKSTISTSTHGFFKVMILMACVETEEFCWSGTDLDWGRFSQVCHEIVREPVEHQVVGGRLPCVVPFSLFHLIIH